MLSRQWANLQRNPRMAPESRATDGLLSTPLASSIEATVSRSFKERESFRGAGASNLNDEHARLQSRNINGSELKRVAGLA